jgi:hypothetical protein
VDWPIVSQGIHPINVHGGFIDKKYIFKYIKLGIIGAMLKLFFWLTWLARELLIRILLFG